MLRVTNSNAKVFEISLGMYYLHEEHVVHGDLKGVSLYVAAFRS